MSDEHADFALLLAEAVWLLLVAGAILTGLDVVMGFIVWFGGFLVIGEVLPPARLRPWTELMFGRIVKVGYLGFVMAAYWIVESWV